MIGGMKLSIDLTDQEAAALRSVCDRERITGEAAVSRALERWLAVEGALDRSPRAPEPPMHEPHAVGRETMPPGFGAWKHAGIDALEYQRAIRAEWEHREGVV